MFQLMLTISTRAVALPVIHLISSVSDAWPSVHPCRFNTETHIEPFLKSTKEKKYPEYTNGWLVLNYWN